ncbi:MAG: XdhC family protein [Lentisphaerae bacterium]|nr:XdhC family protein [Lentisphaerota bacterium]
MNPDACWELARATCAAGGRACLLVVVDRQGSAPNGPGAKLVLTDRGARAGTVGGGASEFQLVDHAAQALAAGVRRPETLTLNHDECAPDSRSGMICGGSQRYVLVYLDASDVPALAAAAQAEREARVTRLVLTPEGLSLDPTPLADGVMRWQKRAGDAWCYEENVGRRDRLTIIGGGHVGLALSRMAALVDYHVTVLDNRPGLSTFEANTYAHARRVVDYGHIADEVPDGPASYVCIMTYGFRHDRDVLRALIHKPVRYLGMLGSLAKVRTVMRDLAAEGLPKALLDRVHAPLGVPIGSRTPEEIAVSITAELIRERRVGDEGR